MPIELVGSFPGKNGYTGPYRRTMAFCQSQGERAKPVPKGFHRKGFWTILRVLIEMADLVAWSWAPTFFASRSVPAGSSSPYTAITTIEQTWLTHVVYALLMLQLLKHLTNSHHPFRMRSIPSPHEPSNLKDFLFLFPFSLPWVYG